MRHTEEQGPWTVVRTKCAETGVWGGSGDNSRASLSFVVESCADSRDERYKKVGEIVC